MKLDSILVIGGGIGGLTAAIALRRKGFPVEIIEKDPDWTVYGVGIIQQFNVIRAMGSLDLLDAYLDEAFGFDRTSIFGPAGQPFGSFDAPRLAGPQYPSNAGIRRTSLQKVLATRARELGATVRLGITAEKLDDDGQGVTVTFSDGSTGRYDIVIGADGVFSRTRRQIFPDAPTPRYTGQWVWRYNFPLTEGQDGIHIYVGRINAGLVPIGGGLMYMFLLSQEPESFRPGQKGQAALMRERTAGAPPVIAALADQITDDDAVVGRPLETIFLYGDWHKGRVVLLGDAVHASTPHLAQGAGMTIEDAIVLADELAAKDTPEAAFEAYRARRYERTKWIAETSVGLGDSQMGLRNPPLESDKMMGESMKLVAQPI